MLRYELDRLGWYEFEGLIQTLLKHLLGLGVESWGGSGDWGRDAYYDGPLAYPAKSQSPGPFLFQCKFVDGANASGANPQTRIKKAVKAEISRITDRVPVWGSPPARYVFLSNAPISGEDRKALSAELQKKLPNAHPHFHDGQDICAWLDNASHIARAFPQILGLRDLEALLTQWTSRDVYNRSQTAVSDARALSTVFVPTSPYTEALATITKHKFVVLEGPPEMGKTAIARMIALGYLARDWEVVECRVPEHFLKAYSKDRPQIFIADDFFGRTEYDPSRISQWQDDLPYILKRLDSEHLFALTTRAHLLNLARHKLDISGYQTRFPELGEVVVDASRLTSLDKARMLYRHCKVADLPKKLRQLVKTQAEEIVSNSHFTPERIRRLVHDVLSAEGAEVRKTADLKVAIEETLSDPGRAMSVSFAALPEPHKWMLFSLLETDYAPYRQIDVKDDQLSDLCERFERLCPTSSRRPAKQISDELSEAFVRIVKRTYARSELDWIHPSVRDLAIGELSTMPVYRKAFLRSCGPEGLKLACSVGGGRTGHLAFPLLVDEEDWHIFSERVGSSMPTAPDLAVSLAGNLDTASADPTLKDKSHLLRKVLSDIAIPGFIAANGDVHTWQSHTSLDFLSLFHEGMQHDLFKGLSDVWVDDSDSVARAIKRSSQVVDEIDSVIEVLKVGEALAEKSSIRKDEVAASVQKLMDTISRAVAEEYEYLRRREEPMDLDSEIYSITELRDHFRIAKKLATLHGLVHIERNLADIEDVLDVMESLNEPSKASQQPGPSPTKAKEVPIVDLFEDL